MLFDAIFGIIQPMNSVMKTPDFEVEVIALREEVATLNRQLDWFKRQIFGEKSEKRVLIDNPDQHSLLNENVPDSSLAAEEQKPVSAYSRGKAKKDRGNAIHNSGLRFDDSVPVEHIRITPVELTGPDADQYEVIGEKITHRLAQNPASFVVIEYTEVTIKRKDTNRIIKAASASSVFDKSIVDVSFLAAMLVDKFTYHCPLYRQHQKLQQNGFKLSRSSLTNWTTRSIDLLAPIYHAHVASILRSNTLAMDETPIKAGHKEKGKMNKAFFWPIYGDEDEVAFTFSTTRKHGHVTETLKGFSGTLLTDGYAAYKQYAAKTEGITHAQCWIHTRRYFEQSLNAEPHAAAQALEIIGKIYQQEKVIRDKQLVDEKKLTYRTDHCLPLVKTFFAWCHEQRQREDLVNSNPLSKALVYAVAREHELNVFLSDPQVQPDTNHLERALRVIPMGRKNWMFSWTELGAKQMGMIQSLLVTCKLHDINPYTYLVDVLQRVGHQPASKVDELIPRNWKKKFANDPLRSDLGVCQESCRLKLSSYAATFLLVSGFRYTASILSQFRISRLQRSGFFNFAC
jgi:transposase